MSNFSCSLTRNITSYSMENLAFHSLLRWKMITLPILMHYLTHKFFFKRENITYLSWEWKGTNTNGNDNGKCTTDDWDRPRCSLTNNYDNYFEWAHCDFSGCGAERLTKNVVNDEGYYSTCRNSSVGTALRRERRALQFIQWFSSDKKYCLLWSAFCWIAVIDKRLPVNWSTLLLPSLKS